MKDATLRENASGVPAPATGRLVVAAIVLAAMAGCLSIRSPAPERTVDGLVRVARTQVDTVYVAPGMSLAPYRRVMLDPVNVAFKRDWQRNHPEVDAGDMARIRAETSRLFHDTFSRELGRGGGYAMADAPDSDVLQVTASIVDLDITAPDRRAPGVRVYVISPGELTLLAELRDARSGAILARVADREKGRDFGDLRIADSVTNSAEAQRAFAMWAGLLRDALDAAKQEQAPR